MFNHYEGWSEKDLLDLRRTVQRRDGSGAVTKSSIAGVTVEKAIPTGGSHLVTLKRIQSALWLLGQAKVAAGEAESNPYQNPYTATVKRTRTTYV